ncbi:MAG TPA: DUF1667 domain-containing protein [Fastidiosipila sp.]|jgi:CxxC motif-containing protein|nr:DUF1667 domain-containing protein [Fastidiosipila sp.]
MKTVICIVCPKGCHLNIDEEHGYEVSGFGCERGIAYGVEEVRRPMRMITSTVRIDNAALPRCPVKLDKPIDKHLIMAAMKELDQVRLTSPVSEGQIVVENVCGSGASFISTRSL